MSTLQASLRILRVGALSDILRIIRLVAPATYPPGLAFVQAFLEPRECRTYLRYAA